MTAAQQAQFARHQAIAYLEQHQARQLAEELRDHADELDRVAGSIGPRDVVSQKRIEQQIRAVAESMRDVASKARRQVETAHKLPDEQILDFVRHEYLPKWGDAMEALGYEWDPVKLRYHAPEDVG